MAKVLRSTDELTRLKFESRVKVDNKTGCWIWKGKTTNGYGTFQNIQAHRASWMLYRGVIPKGRNVCHNCPEGDNPICVNPDHLFTGTQKDNIQDCLRKGRFNHGSRR